MPTTIDTIGIIGLGKMGAPILRHLVRGGFTTIGVDVDPAAMQRARDDGASVAESPAALAARAELIIVLTAFEAQVEQVIFGPEGIVAGAKPGTIVAIGATISPSAMQDMAKRLHAAGLVALDIPLCRGEPAAEAGKLLITGGGDAAAFERCRPAFATFADAIHHLGEAGAGQVGKMVNNLTLWACISANHEGNKLADAFGVDRERMRGMLVQSSAQNWALSSRIGEIGMPWAEKDMMIVLHEADAARISLPLCGTVKEVIKGIKLARGDW